MEVGVAREGAAGACGGLSGTFTESVGGGHPVQLRITKSRDREGKGQVLAWALSERHVLQHSVGCYVISGMP